MNIVKCLFCEHQWSQWHKTSRITDEFIHKAHQRTCKKCGKKQYTNKCVHLEKDYVRTVYGDEINIAPGRGVWKCRSCGKTFYGKMKKEKN